MISTILSALGWLIKSPVGQGVLLTLSVLTLLVLLYQCGYDAGEGDARARQQAQVDEAVYEAAKRADALQRRLSAAEQDAAKQIATGGQKQRVITREVVRYVRRTPSLDDCGLDADGMRLWAAANAGEFDGTESPGNIDAAVSGAPTASER